MSPPNDRRAPRGPRSSSAPGRPRRPGAASSSRARDGAPRSGAASGRGRDDARSGGPAGRGRTDARPGGPGGRGRADARPGAARDGRRGGPPRAPKRDPQRPARLDPIKSTRRLLDPERLIQRQPWHVLRPYLEAPGVDVERVLHQLRGYAHSLLEWNRGVSNLISHNDEIRLVERHIAESLRPAALLRDSGCETFVDLGSGAGLPAIPLALAGVGARWTLVESRRNKTLFIRKYLQDSAVKNIAVKTSRLETLIEEAPEELACDGFTSRATMTIGPTLEMAASIVRPGGKAFLWKGSGYEQEMKSTEREWSAAWRFISAEPVSEGLNVVAVFEKI